MEMVMCRSCGEFVQAFNDDGEWTPRLDECPDCDGTEFKHIGTDTIVRTDE